ncbi:UDP-N-acetyl-D-mannosamine 6-dehydrogenase [Byssothecium circinans]|uniref:UDP-N-acetyl-D-mannosamine 6-dehydrogenase n=1 Tax=Byssothecium circinans TaxID=147558 RepID=A0A6A5UIV2_9PLEO|nr:UDP-N-acetyl-D-mannosamine 6-dehydrogenase [Byssothecium circinans]
MAYTHRRKPSNQIVPTLRRVSPRRDIIDIQTITPCVCIVGVGYVGESLLREFSRRFKTIGFDISQQRIDALKKSYQCLPNVTLTTDTEKLAQATHYLISVPTLLKDDQSVNLIHVLSAISMVLSYARPGSAIVLESTVCVGTTRQFFTSYKDTYHCGMSPERVDPGRPSPTAKEIPKLVSGLTPKALDVIQSLYAKVFDKVIPVSSPETAEMTKLFENCQRMINIAYVNEMADAAQTHGVDPHEMIQAASSKPYGFTPFSPGLGVGGHCIPVNPFYLFANNKNLPVLGKATAQMRKRPRTKARKLHELVSSTLADHSPRILVVGLGYKPGQSVLSCSPGLAFARKLRNLGCSRLAFYDPLVQREDVKWIEKLEDVLWCTQYLDENFDAIAICIRQMGVDFGVLETLQKMGSGIKVQEFR